MPTEPPAVKKVDNRIDPATLPTADLRQHIKDCRAQLDKIDLQLDSYAAGITRREPAWLVKAKHARRSFDSAILASTEELAYRMSESAGSLNAAFVEVAREDMDEQDFIEMMEDAKKRLEPRPVTESAGQAS